MKNVSRAVSLAIALGSMVMAQGPQHPVLRAGVSVDMATTQHAVTMPQADEVDALVVAVTAKGRVYLGVTPISPTELQAKVKGGKPVYIKADSRAAYAGVARALDAVGLAGLSTASLLTSQNDTPRPGFPLPPQGLDVRLGTASAGAAVVEVRSQGDAVRINGRGISMTSLAATLEHLVQATKVVVVKAEGPVAYGDVVRVIDACVGAGASVRLVSQVAATQ